jgi:hypothetical protein
LAAAALASPTRAGLEAVCEVAGNRLKSKIFVLAISARPHIGYI